MNRLASVITGGIAGTGTMAVVLVLMEVQTRNAIGIFAVIARFVRLPGELALGFLVYAVVGSVVWPLVFVAIERYIPRGPDPAVRGMVFALVLWIPFVITGRGDLTGPVIVIYGAFTLLAHLVYGFTMGAVYASLADRPTTDHG